MVGPASILSQVEIATIMHIAISFPMDTVRKSFDRQDNLLGRAVANHSFLLGLAQTEAGHRITLFVPSPEDVELLNRTLLAGTQSKIYCIPRLAITQYLEEHPIDVLHFMDPKMSMGGHIRNHLSERNFVITGLTHSLGDQIMDCILQNHANGIEPGDCLICTTPTAQSAIASMCAHLSGQQPDLSLPQTEVIPLGLDLAAFQEPTQLTRQDLGLPDKDFVILSLARFNPLSKMDILPVLILLQMIRQKGIRTIKLVLAGSEGDGKYIQLLKDWARKTGIANLVLFIKSPTDEQKMALYQHADVFLSLSDNVQETFGLTVVEALASGLPAVVSDWNGYKSLVKHDVTGIRVPTKMLARDEKWEASLSLLPFLTAHMLCAQTTAVDLPAARDAILSLEADREGLKRMSKAATRSAIAYDWKQVLPQYFTLWKTLREKQLATSHYRSNRNRRTSTVRFLHEFSSYPSTQLSPDDRFATSELGQLVVNGAQSIYPYKEMQGILNHQLMNSILKSCLVTRTVRELLDTAQSAGSPQIAFKVSRNLIWLYKYGYLEAK